MSDDSGNGIAETVADNILRAAGSGLRHYSMHSIRAGIISATQSALLAAEKRGAEQFRDKLMERLCPSLNKSYAFMEKVISEIPPAGDTWAQAIKHSSIGFDSKTAANQESNRGRCDGAGLLCMTDQNVTGRSFDHRENPR
jgi:hypothetical protein